MKTIIACTDFSQSSINACEYAAFLAEKLNCKLTLLNVFEAPVIHSNVGLYGITYSSERKKSAKKVTELKEQLQRRFKKLKIEFFITGQDLKLAIEDFDQKHQIEAAVMGLETKTRITKFIYGSHGVNLAGKLNCPVIIVPSQYKEHQLKNVLLSVDNNEKLLKSSLGEFEKLLKNSKGHLSLLHVRTGDEIYDPVIDKLKINGKKTDIETIRSKDLQTGIKNYCKRQDIDLITIISKKHSIFYNFFSESNTKQIAFAAKVPVMAIHE